MNFEAQIDKLKKKYEEIEPYKESPSKGCPIADI